MIWYINYFRRCVTLGRPPSSCHKVSHSAAPPLPRERYVIRGANSQISWGGKIFFWRGRNFFLRCRAKSSVSAPPYWKQFMYWNVIKFDMLVHILNIESMKQIKKKFGNLGGGRRPPQPPQLAPLYVIVERPLRIPYFIFRLFSNLFIINFYKIWWCLAKVKYFQLLI